MTIIASRLLCISGFILVAASVGLSQSHPMASTTAGGGAVPNYNDVNHQQVEADDMQASRDRDFVKNSLEEGSALAKLNELAQQNSQSDDVKQFAQKTADDRKQLDTQLSAVAKQIGLPPPKDISHRDKKLIAKLEGFNGPKFDEEYISAMVKLQQNDVKDYSKEAGKTKNLQLRDIVQDSGTMISRHLQAIEAIAQTHHVMTH